MTAPSASGIVQCVEYRGGKRHRHIDNLDEISDALGEPNTVIWIDVVDPTPEQLEVLRREFDLHPLALEDVQTPHERPKIEAFDKSFFLIVHPASIPGKELVVHEMAVFVGTQYLVTIHRTPRWPMDEVERRWNLHDGEMGNDAGFMLYTLLDTIVDGYFPISDNLEERINELQTALFDDASVQKTTLLEIFTLKNIVHHLRRAVVPMRDILQPIIRGDLRLFDSAELPYYRDVYDHAIRVVDQLDSARDLVNSSLDIHLSLTASRQNEVAKQLTIIATIFLPLTYITGFFGQNFGWLVNGITSQSQFWWLGVGSEVVAFIALLAYFRWKRWF
jgi:magnesium transporter